MKFWQGLIIIQSIVVGHVSSGIIFGSSGILNSAGQIFNTPGQIANNPLDTIGQAVNAGTNVLSGITNGMNNPIGDIINNSSNGINGIVNGFNNAAQVFTNVSNNILQGITNALQGLLSQSEAVVSAIMTSSQNLFGNTASLLNGTVQAAWDEFEKTRNTLLSNSLAQVNNTFTQFQALNSSVTNSIGKLVENAAQQFQIMGNQFGNCSSNISNNTRALLQTASTDAFACVSKQFALGQAAFQAGIENVSNAFNNLRINGILDCINTQTSSIDIAASMARATCLANAIVSVNSKILLLPVQVSQQMANAQSSFLTFKSEILKCNSQIMSGIANQALNAQQLLSGCLGNNTNSSDLLPNVFNISSILQV